MLLRNVPAALSFSNTAFSRVELGNILPFTTLPMTMAFWIKPRGITTTYGVLGKRSGTDQSYAVYLRSRGRIDLFVNNADYAQSPVDSIKNNEWNHVVFTLSAGGVLITYVNGLAVATATSVPAPGISANNLKIGDDSVASYSNVAMSDVMFYNTVLTAADIMALYKKTTIPTGLVGRWKLDEGAGTVAFDSSGAGNNGTLTSSPVYIADTPSNLRKPINRNLVQNGDFEYAPPFTAATNTVQRWVDGTAAGSITNDLFAWPITTKSGTAAAQFDTSNPRSGLNSLKISTQAVSSFIEVHQNRVDTDADRLSATLAGKLVKCLPNTSYTYSFWMRTQLNSGDSSDGAFATITEVSGTGSVLGGGGITSKVKVTQGWTQYTGSFTTTANTRFLLTLFRIYGHTGTGTLIMDAWFDDVVIKPTTPTARQLSTA